MPKFKSVNQLDLFAAPPPRTDLPRRTHVEELRDQVIRDLKTAREPDWHPGPQFYLDRAAAYQQEIARLEALGEQ